MTQTTFRMFSPVGYEHRTLPPLPEGAVAWSGRDEPYQAAIPAVLADAAVPVAQELLADADEATIRLAKYSVAPKPAGFAQSVLAVEAMSSSAMEGVHANALDVEAALGGLAVFRDENALVAANVQAAWFAAHAGGLPVRTTHSMLMSGTHPDWAGTFRNQQVWIGWSLPHDAEFVPPHHDRVEDAMSDLTRFAGRTDIPALAHAAIAQAQFQTIHPFQDGNGRTGRALIQPMLRAAGIVGDWILPISSGFVRRRQQYVAALQSFRAGDADPIVREFTWAVFDALRNTEQLVSDLRDAEYTTAAALDGLRSDSTARRLADLSAASPMFTSTSVALLLKVSPSAAHGALDELVGRGVLSVYDPGMARNRMWLNPAVLSARDDFVHRTKIRWA
jgi:hypothetical protein